MDKDKEDRLYKNLSLFPEHERLKALELIVKGNLLREEKTTELEQVTVSDNSYLFVGDNQVNTIEKGSWNYSKKANKTTNKNESMGYVVQSKGVYLGDSWHEKVFKPLVAKVAKWDCDINTGPLFPPHNGREWKKTFPQGAKGLGIMLNNCTNVPAGYLKCNSADLRDAKGPECVVLFRKQIFEKAVELGLITQVDTDEKEKAAPKEQNKKNEEAVNPFQTIANQNVNQSGIFKFN